MGVSCRRKDMSDMKINNNEVTMGSNRTYSKVQFSSVSLSVFQASNYSKGSTEKRDEKKQPVTLELSKSAQEFTQKLRELTTEERQKEKPAAPKESGSVASLVDSLKDTEEDMQIKILKQILKSLREMREGKFSKCGFDLERGEKPGKHTTNQPVSNLFAQGTSTVMPGSSGQTWVREIKASYFMAEQENTTFSTVGKVQTEDGRTIEFNVDLEMSHSFMEAADYFQEDVYKLYTDPLVINMDSTVTSVSDQKFLFDLNADGTEEEISYLGKGSGFLSLDKNGDGKVNDGNELFGTKSGNGFQDLAEYDKDGNGWIDEKDAIFGELKIWSKNADGTDRLVGIKEAGVGALYLGNVSTEFSLKNQKTNEENAVVRKSGIYLSENGKAGTLQHIDLVL